MKLWLLILFLLKKKQLALSSNKIKYSNDDSKKSWIIEQT